MLSITSPRFLDVTGDGIVDVVTVNDTASGAELTGNGVTVVVDGRSLHGGP